MRLFTAIAPPEPAAPALERLLADLRPTAKLRWTTADNLHITTKFIGAWPEERLGEMSAPLAGVARRPPIPISIDGLGWHPNPHRPRVLFAGVRGGEALESLAREIDQIVAALGFEPEKRPYSPHLTLARIPEGSVLTALRPAVAKLGAASFGRFEAESFSLYASLPGAAGSVYTKLREIRFTA